MSKTTLYLIMKESKRQMHKSGDKTTSLYLQADFNYTWAVFALKGKAQAHRDILQGKFDLYKAACLKEGRRVVSLKNFQ